MEMKSFNATIRIRPILNDSNEVLPCERKIFNGGITDIIQV